MTPLNEITSTEKLLDFIRKKSGPSLPDSGGPENVPASVTTPPMEPLPGKIAKIIPFTKISPLKQVTIGVDIGHTYLRLAKTMKGSDGLPILIDIRQVKIPPSLDRRGDDFVNLLRMELDFFCGKQKKHRIWAIMSAADVDVRHIRIPKVPKKQIENVVYWTVKKETPFDEKETILDFEVLGEVAEQGIAKLAVMYYIAPKRAIEAMKRLFSRAGWPLTGLSIVPFAVQNICRTKWLEGDEGVVASMFIGNDFSRIDIYDCDNLVMTRGIKAGINSMLEALAEGLQERKPPAAKGADESQLDIEAARKALFSLSPDSSPLEENDLGYGLTEEEIWQMILPAFERLVRQVERTFEHFTVNLGNERVNKIYVSAAMNVYPRIVQYVGSQLNMDSEIFDPLHQQSFSRHDDKIIFNCDAERVDFAPALGIALSDNLHTPNLLFNYKDKEQEHTVKRINGSILVLFLVAISLCSVVFAYQLHAVEQKRKVARQLEQQLSRDQSPVNSEMIMKALSAVKQDTTSAKIYSQRYQGLAIISELSLVTPPGIRLVNVKVNMGNLADKPVAAGLGKADAPARPREEGGKEVQVEGFVMGEKKTFHNALANYVIKLDNSPIFQQIKVQKTNEETFHKAALLRFAITMKLEGL